MKMQNNALRGFIVAGVTSLVMGTTSPVLGRPISESMEAQSSIYTPLAQSDEFGPTDPEKPRTGSNAAPTDERAPKSPYKAALFSAVLPGMGELYAGDQGRAKIFLAVEAAIWIGFASFTVYEDWKRDDAVRFAGERANARLSGRDDAFLDLVGFYESIDEYNTLGRATDPDRPYLPDTPENHWRWESVADQEAFRSLKNSYREANRRSEYVLGIAAVNRIVSVVDAVFSVRRYNRTRTDEFSGGSTGGVRLVFVPESPTPVSLRIPLSL